MKSHCGRATVVAAAVALIVSGCTAADPVEENEEIVEPDFSAFSIAVGECVNDGNRNTTVLPVVVDCAQEHDNEAYLSVVLADGPFPGADVITATAIVECTDGFEQFAGIRYDSSIELDFSWYYPSEASWKLGDREILCLIHEVDGERRPVPSMGTLEGANR